jgi:hypothetical protein
MVVELFLTFLNTFFSGYLFHLYFQYFFISLLSFDSSVFYLIFYLTLNYIFPIFLPFYFLSINNFHFIFIFSCLSLSFSISTSVFFNSCQIFFPVPFIPSFHLSPCPLYSFYIFYSLLSYSFFLSLQCFTLKIG